VSGYVVVESLKTDVTLPPTDPVTLSASCPVGKNVIGGGVELLTPSPNIVLQDSHPHGGTAWRVTLVNRVNNPATADIRVTAICATLD
jgi:hypothetical protein